MRWDYTRGNSGQESPIPIIDSACLGMAIRTNLRYHERPFKRLRGISHLPSTKASRHTRDFGKQGRFILPVGDRAHLVVLVSSCIAILG
jgi:hypothetical protein